MLARSAPLDTRGSLPLPSVDKSIAERNPEYDNWVKSTIWTDWRKFAGNLFPGLIWAVPTTWGILRVVKTGQFLGPGLTGVVVGVIAGWVATNYLGLFQNRKMRRELEQVIDDGLEGHGERFYVGMSEPGGGGVLDPHDRVGFLVLDRDKLRFVDDLDVLELPKAGVKEVRYRPNIHSLFGLGRWISIQGAEKTWLVEPREKRSLLGNRKFSKKLRAEIERWAKP